MSPRQNVGFARSMRDIEYRIRPTVQVAVQ